MTLHVCAMGFDCPYGCIQPDPDKDVDDPKNGILHCTYPSLGLQAKWPDMVEVREGFHCPLLPDRSLIGDILESYEDSLDESDRMFGGDSE